MSYPGLNSGRRCCQTNRNYSTFGTVRAGECILQAVSDCHSAKAAELVGLSIDEMTVGGEVVVQ